MSVDPYLTEEEFLDRLSKILRDEKNDSPFMNGLEDLKNVVAEWLMNNPKNLNTLLYFCNVVINAAEEQQRTNPMFTKEMILEHANLSDMDTNKFVIDFCFARQTQFYGGVVYDVNIIGYEDEGQCYCELLDHIEGDFFDYEFFTSEELCHGEMEIESTLLAKMFSADALQFIYDHSNFIEFRWTEKYRTVGFDPRKNEELDLNLNGENDDT